MNNDLTEILVILDRSGSMAGMIPSTIDALNGFIKAQQALPGEANLTLLQFDTEFEYVRYAVPLKKIKPITREDFEPRGMTALYDAMCLGIDNLGSRLASTHERIRAGKVICVIMTDGLENSSTKKIADVRERTERQAREYNWQFVYLGANQDAIATGDTLGVGKGNSANYAHTSGGVIGAMKGMSQATHSYRATGQSVSNSMVSNQNITGDDDDTWLTWLEKIRKQ